MSSHRILLRRDCVSDYDDFQNEYYYDKETKTTEFVQTSPMPSTCSRYLRAKDELLDEYCNGTTHVKAYFDGSYAHYDVETENAESCGFAFVLNITDLEITHETQLGNEDGAVTITVATNTSGAVQYSLDNFATYQTTNSFNGLKPGSYVAYARSNDATIKDSQSFTINPGASSGPRYQIDYHTEDNKLTEIKIFEKEFSGETEFLKGGGEPLMLNTKGQGDDLYTHIKPTEAQITFWAEEDFKFNEFLQEDERRFRVEIYEEGIMIFSGFILPDVYQEPYLAPPFQISISAVDGLGVLSGYQLSTQAENEITDTRSAIGLIALILNKIGLNLPIVSEINLYADTMVEAADQDPLAQAWLPIACFQNGDKIANCHEALERILKTFQARIYQEQGKWRITRFKEAGDVRNYREFDSTGQIIEATGTTGTIINIGQPGTAPFWIERAQLLRYRSAVKSVTTNYQTGWKANLIPFGNFEDGDFKQEKYLDTYNVLKGWEGGWKQFRKESSSFNYEGYKKFETDLFNAEGTDLLKYADVIRSKEFYLSGDTYFSIGYNIDKRNNTLEDTVPNPALYVEIKCGDYYFNQANADGSKWTTTQTLNNICPTSGDFEYGKYHLSTLRDIEAPPFPGIATVRMTELISTRYFLLDTRIAFIALHTSKANAAEELSRKETNTKEYTEKQEDTVYIGDAEGDILFSHSIRKAGSGADSLVGTQGWGEDNEKLHVINAYDKFSNFQKAKQLLSGSFKGPLKFSDVLYDPFNVDKYFICLGMSWNQKKGTITGEWHEIVTSNTPGYLIDYQGDYAIDTAGNKLRNY